MNKTQLIKEFRKRFIAKDKSILLYEGQEQDLEAFLSRVYDTGYYIGRQEEAKLQHEATNSWKELALDFAKENKELKK